MSLEPTALGGVLEAVLVGLAFLDPDLLTAVTFDPEPAHIVGTGGAIGAILRHLIYLQFSSDRFPWPTLAVNVAGSFGFGAAIFAGAGETTIQLVGIGICGAFTTFSSFSVETVQLYERGDRLLAVANATGNLVLSLAAIGIAWIVVTAGPF
ncbi:fluoride efflux transporter FluC [Natronorubrum sulfidifaciens]|uniref:Fluoride-specific ion channel FluC n=1 Tax=Natronorubrum sulfidifaciens JCM 14089 TaxID=1230460 RepID=L9WBG8_9EURY|nr:CrcB family protein [Natronorubrum sulfidifaciens]ELY46606.1 CrcB protein [Natronorubrum sulfidifaciens JCM 14089]